MISQKFDDRIYASGGDFFLHPVSKYEKQNQQNLEWTVKSRGDWACAKEL